MQRTMLPKEEKNQSAGHVNDRNNQLVELKELPGATNLTNAELSSAHGARPWYKRSSTWINVGEDAAEIGLEVAE